MKKTKRFKKTNTKTKVFQTPNVCYAFEKQGVQGCQIWQFLFGKLGIKILIHCGWRGCCIACAQDAHNIVLVSSIDEIINNRKAGSLSLSLLQNITKLNIFSEQGGKTYQEPFLSPLYNVHTGMAQ